MSVKTWKTEFYSVRATDTSKEGAIKHSIKKWTGLLKKNLKKHNIIRDVNDEDQNKMLRDKVQTMKSFRFYVDASTCALCTNWLDIECLECPLKLMLGHKCDAVGLREKDSLYEKFLDGDARPMLNALKKLARQKKRYLR